MVTRRAPRIAPSILSADFAKLAAELAEIEAGGADWVHVDVMDGRVVPNITIGPLVVEAVRRSTSLPLDVHLMIVEPERYVKDFVRAGASTVGIHVETCPHLHRSLTQIREAGARACRGGVVPMLADATGLARAELDVSDLEHRVLDLGRSVRAEHDPVSDEEHAERRR